MGDAQSRTLLAILNLKTGKTAWADGSFAPPVDETRAGDAARRHAAPGGSPAAEPESRA